MKKILDFLEQKVQWLVFVGGAAFAIYMAWIYLIFPTVGVSIPELSATPLKPGEVDQRIDEALAQQLEQKMQDSRVPQNPPTVPDYLASFTSAMSYGGKPASGYQDANWLILHGVPVIRGNDMPADGSGAEPNIPQGTGTLIVKNNPSSGPVASNAPVTRLPVPPTPTITATRTGLTNVMATVLAGHQVPAEVPPGVDKCWVTVRFELDPVALAREWQDTKLPTNSATEYIQVILKRQQMQSDGTWGPETVVPTLAALKIPPYPSESAEKERLEYLNWAMGHTKDILQPDFYTKVKGDDWAIPGEEMAATAVKAPPFDPTPYVDMDPAEFAKQNLTPDQKRLVAQAKQKKLEENTRGSGRRGNSRPTPRPPSRGGGGAEQAPFDPDRPGINFQPVDEDENRNAAVQGEGTTIGNAVGLGKFLLPSGMYDPIAWAKKSKQPIIGWAHDDTATPGATYRYSVSYKMRNPVYAAQLTVVRDASLSEQFFIASKTSDWSQPIDVASTITFYIAAVPKGNMVTMQVFRWKGGEPRSKTFQVVVGDPIGQSDGEVDYATGWTVVDFHGEGTRDDYVLLMDPFGNMHRRDVRADTTDPKYLKLKDQTAQPAPAAAAAAQ